MRWMSHLEVSYCTNVHPGEGLDALHTILNQDLEKVKAQVSPDELFGTGLRLGVESVTELADPQRLVGLKRAIKDQGFYVFSVNGFPYGDFAAPSVKTTVYDPDWSTEERTRYTIDLARVIAQLPGPEHRSISTVAGGFEPHPWNATMKDEMFDRKRRQQFSIQFGRAAQALYELEEETGVSVRLALEPEPWTSLERAEQVGPFFERYVWPSSPHAQRYWGLCYDTCHQALAFEDPRHSWDTIVTAQVPIFKVQISNALRLTQPRDQRARERLLGFSEPRYLHQVTALSAQGEVLRTLDLPQLYQPSEEWLDAKEWRCHFHVPIWWRGSMSQLHGASASDEKSLDLTTTRDFWEGIAEIITDPHAQSHTSSTMPLHVEVETYSWGVLPAHLRQGRTLISEIIKELETLRSHMRINKESHGV